MVTIRSRIMRGGFSLTEALLVIAITGILFGLGPQLFIQVTRFVQTNQVKTDLQREARAALSIINRNLRQATRNSILIDRTTASQPPCSRITFRRIDGTTFTFYQQNTNLIMQTWSPNATRTLSADLRYLAFVPPRSEDLSIVSVSLTLEKAIYEGKTKALHMASEKVMVMNE